MKNKNIKELIILSVIFIIIIAFVYYCYRLYEPSVELDTIFSDGNLIVNYFKYYFASKDYILLYVMSLVGYFSVFILSYFLFRTIESKESNEFFFLTTYIFLTFNFLVPLFFISLMLYLLIVLVGMMIFKDKGKI